MTDAGTRYDAGACSWLAIGASGAPNVGPYRSTIKLCLHTEAHHST